MNDEIVIEAHRHRSQECNRRDEVERLEELLTRARHVPEPRKKTRPSRAVRARPVAGKRLHQAKKRLRDRPALD